MKPVAHRVASQKVTAELQPILIDGEQVESAYKLIRDFFVFTNKRLIFVNKQGLTGKKKEYASIPYHSIVHFSVETAGTFDLDSDLKIFLTGGAAPISQKILRDADIRGLQRTLASYILR